MSNSDSAVLTFTITIVRRLAAAITATAPAALTEAALDGAELTVALTRSTFASTATASDFTLNTDVDGLTIASLAPVSAGDTSATLTLAYDDTDFDTARTVAVTVGAGAHVLPGPIAATASVAVTPSLEANATPSALTLNEDSNHANNARTFTAVLDSLPAATTTVTVASADTGAATVDKASLTFTTTDWNTAQTVTVTAQADDDANDEEVAVTLTEASVGVLATVTVTVEDDDRGTVLIDADPTTAALDPGPLLLDEGDGANYTVRLSAAPSATATVALPPLGAIAGDLESVLADVHHPELEHPPDGGGAHPKRRRRLGRVHNHHPHRHRRRLRRHRHTPAREHHRRRAHRHGLRRGQRRPHRGLHAGPAQRHPLGPGRQRRGVGRQHGQLQRRQRRLRQRQHGDGLPRTSRTPPPAPATS